MHHDFVAPTLCFSSHCDCYGGMPAPSPPGGVAGSDTPGSPLQDLSAVVPGARASRCSVLHRLRFVCMVWGHCPCAFFFPVTPVQDFPRCHCPLFYILPFPLALPEPVNVYIVLPLVSACLRHVRPAPPVSQPAHRRDQAPLPFVTQPCRRGHLYRMFHYGLKLGGRAHLVPRLACR